MIKMKNNPKQTIVIIVILFLLVSKESNAQLFNFDLYKLRKEWGYWDFERANTARFSFYMGRVQKRTILYMNMARQDGEKFSNLIVTPYVEKHPEHSKFKIELHNKVTHMLYPSFRLWLSALPHPIISGVIGSIGHQGMDARMFLFLNLNTRGENCSYGYFRGIDVTLQLLNSPGHRANILNDEFARTAVSKFPHIEYGWNSVTTFSGPKFFDLAFRNLYDIKHIQANFSISTDFKNPIYEISIGQRLRQKQSVNSSRWSIGTEIISSKTAPIVAPKIHWASEYYYFALGGNVISPLASSGFSLLIRPEVSFRFPFSRNNGFISYLDLEKSKSSIGISYGYNINLTKSKPFPYNAHQIALTYSKNFGFKKKK
jgi:hypothetical protein